MNNLIAQIQLGPLRGIGSLGLEKDTTGQGALGVFSNFISSAIGLMTIIAIIWFTFVLITGAIAMISAGGDKAQVENARKRISTGLIGLVVVIAALFIIDLIGTLIGIPNILNISQLFGQITK